MHKPQTNAPEPSRRSFARRAAAALLAAPALALLHACKDDAKNQPSNDNHPGPSPTPTPHHVMADGSNPPVIIDSASLDIYSLTDLDQTNGGGGPRPKRITPAANSGYGGARSVRIADEIGNVYFPHDLQAGDALMVKVWLQTATMNPDGTVSYDPSPIPSGAEPQFTLAATYNAVGFTMESSESVGNAPKNKHFWSKKKAIKQYGFDKLGAGPNARDFRIGQISITINATTETTTEADADNGLRVIVQFAPVP